ncbi:MAG: hypothetical protein ACHQ7N_14555 [Candidatus Methylomirabilales bacterium]
MQPLANQGPLEWSRLGPVTTLLVSEVFYGALAFMVLAYLIKIRQLLKLPPVVESTPPRGDEVRGIRYAYLTLALPWTVEGQRQDWSSYVEFACLHIVIAFNLGVAISLPVAHEALRNSSVILALQWILTAGAGIGIIRLANRLTRREMRAISAPDDYFSLAMLTLWMLAGVSAVSQDSEGGLLAFYLLATFFVIYMPFSKISHFVYWAFARYYMGKHFGHRGVYPRKVLPKVG